MHRIIGLDDGKAFKFKIPFEKNEIPEFRNGFRSFVYLCRKLKCNIMKDFKKDRVRGSLIGGAIGDALGYPVEFLKNFQVIENYYGKGGITRMDTLNDAGKGLISDDTQMTLFTACGLLNAKEKGMAPVPAICQAYLEWYYTQKGVRSKRLKDCWIGDLPEMNEQRAPGITCIDSLDMILQGQEPVNDSKGCGGIMRVAPIALYGLAQDRIKNVSALDDIAAETARLTHKHPLGYIPAYILSHLIYRLATDEKPARESFITYLDESMKAARDKYDNQQNCLDEQQTLLDKAVKLAGEDIPDHEAILQIGEGWVAEETLAIAVYCTCKYLDDFEKAVVAAVNHGGDSDSTGAVTGNLMGATVGYEAIPEHFTEDLEMRDVILHVADDLWRGYTTRFVRYKE